MRFQALVAVAAAISPVLTSANLGRNVYENDLDLFDRDLYEHSLAARDLEDFDLYVRELYDQYLEVRTKDSQASERTEPTAPESKDPEATESTNRKPSSARNTLSDGQHGRYNGYFRKAVAGAATAEAAVVNEAVKNSKAQRGGTVKVEQDPVKAAQRQKLREEFDAHRAKVKPYERYQPVPTSHEDAVTALNKMFPVFTETSEKEAK